MNYLIRFFKIALFLLTTQLSMHAHALDEIVQKQVFEMPSLKTSGGAVIKNVRFGFETYGKLNAAADNAILICHFFSGTSHAAGKYAASDASAGYWDSIIGPGKPLDTNKYFIVSADSLSNLNVHDPRVITTGPASTNPDTGKPYGMSFPILVTQDLVKAQKALIDSLGIKKLNAVAGLSMGSYQALDWAATYPSMVERVMAVIPGGLESNAFSIEVAQTWANPILLDSNWKNGDYYNSNEKPIRGLEQALQLTTLNSRNPAWADRLFARKFTLEGKNPQANWEDTFAVQDAISKAGAARAKLSDANHLLYLTKIMQLYRIGNAASVDEGVKSIKSRVLFLPAASDLLFFPSYAKNASEILRKNGIQSDVVEIPGDGGHLDGITDIARVSDSIRKFLDY
jgi:homoserine O-acetyltransferase